MKITITWKAFGNQPERKREITSATFNLSGAWETISNEPLCSAIYHVTNLQDELGEFNAHPEEIALWKTIEAILPANRTHTSLSIGDTIQISRSPIAMELNEGPIYKVADIGFELVGA